jgi:hypothetical protein
MLPRLSHDHFFSKFPKIIVIYLLSYHPTLRVCSIDTESVEHSLRSKEYSLSLAGRILVLKRFLESKKHRYARAIAGDSLVNLTMFV